MTENYYNGIRITQRYLDYSMYVEKSIRQNILDMSDVYLCEAERAISRTDQDYERKKQEIALLKLYKYAYGNHFSLLDSKLAIFSEQEIDDANKMAYLFLKYITEKALSGNDSGEAEEKLRQMENSVYYFKKAGLILGKT